MQVSVATLAGSPHKPNEDWIGITPRAVVLLDGLTAPAGLTTGCVHGVPWYVSHLGIALLGELERLDVPLKVCLGAAIDRVAKLHLSTCNLRSGGTPQAAVAVLRSSGAALEWLVLADVVIIVERSGHAEVITDDRVQQVAQREQAAVHASRIGTEVHRKRVNDLVQKQRKWRNHPDGYWVAGANPEAASHAFVGHFSISDVKRAAALSDGAGRIVEFGLCDWSDVLPKLDVNGPGGLIAEVRRAEADDQAGVRWPRFKVSDDASVAYVAAF